MDFLNISSGHTSLPSELSCIAIRCNMDRKCNDKAHSKGSLEAKEIKIENKEWKNYTQKIWWQRTSKQRILASIMRRCTSWDPVARTLVLPRSLSQEFSGISVPVHTCSMFDAHNVDRGILSIIARESSQTQNSKKTCRTNIESSKYKKKGINIRKISLIFIIIRSVITDDITAGRIWHPSHLSVIALPSSFPASTTCNHLAIFNPTTLKLSSSSVIIRGFFTQITKDIDVIFSAILILDYPSNIS